MHNYDDIIDMDYPFKLKHPRMSVSARACQFAPFAALTGHKESIDETSRITDEKGRFISGTGVQFGGPGGEPDEGRDHDGPGLRDRPGADFQDI